MYIIHMHHAPIGKKIRTGKNPIYSGVLYIICTVRKNHFIALNTVLQLSVRVVHGYASVVRFSSLLE